MYRYKSNRKARRVRATGAYNFWINDSDTPWGQDGAIFSSWQEAETAAQDLVRIGHDASFDELMNSLREVDLHDTEDVDIALSIDNRLRHLAPGARRYLSTFAEGVGYSQARRTRRVRADYDAEDYLNDLWKQMGGLIYLMDQSHNLAKIPDDIWDKIMEAKDMVSKAQHVIERINQEDL